MLTRTRLQVIDEINRYGLSLYDGHTEYRLRRRMELDKLVVSYRLWGKVRYYRLQGEHSLGPQQLRHCYAVATWCRSEGYVKAHRWEKASAFPWLHEQFDCATGPGGLALFKIDMGGHPAALVRKAVAMHLDLRRHEGYLANKPTVWILTATEFKGREILRHIARTPHSNFIRASVVADFDKLTGAIHHATAVPHDNGQHVRRAVV